MKVKRNLKALLFLSITAVAISLFALKADKAEYVDRVKVYAGELIAAKTVKGTKKTLKTFSFITEKDSKSDYSVYVDSKNNKIYVDAENFFEVLSGTQDEAEISIDIKKKTLKVNTEKNYKYNYNYFTAPKSLYEKPVSISVAINGKKTSVNGFVVKSNGYWYAQYAIYIDFEPMAKKLGLMYDKNISKKKCMMYPKLSANILELKRSNPWWESYEEGEVTYIGGYDVGYRWAVPIKNYLYEEDGNLVRVEAAYTREGKGKVTIARFDSKGKQISEKGLDFKGQSFGGFYRGEDYNYFIFGNSNAKKSDTKEVISIVKLDRKFNELAMLSVSNCYTVYPFKAGSLRCAEIGSMVLVHTARERYDGHQSQLTIVFNEDTMSLLNEEDLGAFQRNHISHDFNQFALADGKEFILVDHGDAYPRSIQVSWLRTETLLQEYLPFEGSPDNFRYQVIEREMFSVEKSKEILEIPGETGANQTGVSIGSVAQSAGKVLVGVNRIDYSKAKSFDSFDITGKDVYKRDVVLYSLDKNSLEVIENKYTDYNKEKNVTFTAPKLVKIDDVRFMCIWNKQENKDGYSSGKTTLQYLMVDENGKKLSDIRSIEGMKVAYEMPIVYNGKVVWSENRFGRLILNTIPIE